MYEKIKHLTCSHTHTHNQMLFGYFSTSTFQDALATVNVLFEMYEPSARLYYQSHSHRYLQYQCTKQLPTRLFFHSHSLAAIFSIVHRFCLVAYVRFLFSRLLDFTNVDCIRLWF